MELTMRQKMAAYKDISQRFNLKAAKRDMMDAYPHLQEMLEAEHVGDYSLVRGHLLEAGIITQSLRIAPHGGCNWQGCEECFPKR